MHSRLIDDAMSSILENIEADIKENIASLLASKNWNIYRGVFVNRVEKLLSEILGGYCLVTNSGTSAIELALRSCRCEGEAVVPCSTFVATAQAAFLAGMRPHISPVDSRTLTLGVEQAVGAVNKRTGAIIAVHLFGNSSHAIELAEFCRKRGVVLIEDCAQTFDGKINGLNAGTIGTASAFSFNESKHVTCGDGGAFLSTSRETFLAAKAIRHAGLRQAESGIYSAHEVGGKNLMTEFQAAVLLPQLERWAELKAVRLHQANRATEWLSKLPGGKLVEVSEHVEHAWQRVAFILEESNTAERLLEEYEVLERFYPLPLTEEPIVRERAIIAPETAALGRSLWERVIGITLRPFVDSTIELKS